MSYPPWYGGGMKNQKTESRQQNHRITDQGTTGPGEGGWQQCMLRWDRESGKPGAGSQERITEDQGRTGRSIFDNLPVSADGGLAALRFCVLFPRMVSSRRSQKPWAVVERIRRRYRRRLGPRAKWREYVAELTGVSAQTVGAWRSGTVRPSPERKAKLLEICRELGKARRGRMAENRGQK